MDLVRRISIEHLVLRDQALRAFSEKYLMAELDGRAHLAALDQVGVGLENGKDFLVIGNLLAIEHAATCLIDHTAAKPAKVLDLLAQLLDSHGSEHIPAALPAGRFECSSRVPYDLFGNADERTVLSGLLLLALPRRHALDLVHATSGRTRAIAKPLDSSQFQRVCQAPDQPRDDAHDIP